MSSKTCPYLHLLTAFRSSRLKSHRIIFPLGIAEKSIRFPTAKNAIFYMAITSTDSFKSHPIGREIFFENAILGLSLIHILVEAREARLREIGRKPSKN